MVFLPCGSLAVQRTLTGLKRRMVSASWVLSATPSARTLSPGPIRVARLVQTLPVFENFDPERLTHVTQECAEMLQVDGGLDAVLALIGQAVPLELSETAYALAVEIAVADLNIAREEIRFLARLRDALGLDKLVTAAIERSATARYQSV